MRARLDEALEEVAFLREQLRSAEAWSAHVVETLRIHHRVAREIFVRDLGLLIEGLDQHARVREVAAEVDQELVHPAFAAQEREEMR